MAEEAAPPEHRDRGGLSGSYDPAAIEDPIYHDWESNRLFHADPHDDGEPHCIVIPPPNVTGSLHIGHALDNAIQDAITRRERMRGKNAVWIPGTDHAGIATQNVVEKQIADEGQSRHDLGRDAFIERVWAWREESGGTILQQLRRLGASCDWEREAFTFDGPRSRAVREVFVGLYEQGLIYRGYRLINWCPRCATALSDIEVEHEEIEGELAHLRYPATDGGDGVVVATTRVETMLGDTAVAVHPADARYADLVGKTVRLPLMDRELKVIADEAVDPEFGTGAVKVTPGHDATDYEIGMRHDLEQIDVMTDDARINENGGRFAGMDRYEAREAIKKALDEEGVLVSVEPHAHAVGHCSRCETVVEPRLSDQWFVKVRPLADKAHAMVRRGAVEFSPERFTKPFLTWLENLHDWCISRQLWWGHRIPAWYCEDGHITVARDDVGSCGECSKPVQQDEDVLDTWFSSQLWPFVVLGWPDQTPEFETWFPTSVLVTGYDINTFWVSRMVMISAWFLDEVPFHVVHNHGMVRDRNGKKMSKSFGNVIDPLEFIDRHGADALRFALFQHCSPGADVPLAEEWVEGSRRFGNKLWNATKFVLSAIDGEVPAGLPEDGALALEDRWILSRLTALHNETDAAYDRYDWASAGDALYGFAWREFADWYLEAAKVRLSGGNDHDRQVAQRVLVFCLERLLVLLHPLMPFLTEHLWRALVDAEGGRDSLMIQPWPEPVVRRDEPVEASFAVLQDLVTEVRRFRSQNNVAPSKRFDLAVVTTQRELLEALKPLACALAGAASVSFAEQAPDEPGMAKVVFGSGEAFTQLAGLIDVDAEVNRLGRELAAAQAEQAKVEGKLGNASFVERAPAEVVERERDRLNEWARVIDELEQQLAALAGA